MTDRTIPLADNAGLALHKFDLRVPTPAAQDGNSDWGKFTKTRFAAAASIESDTPAYARAYERWQVALRNLPGEKLAGTFSVNGRMIVGIGQASVLENSITLHRLWGTPYIPGSALKGLARHYALWLTRYDESGLTHEDVDTLFGTTNDGGLVTFHDAWYVPATARDIHGKPGNPLILDVVTGHHGDWYMQKEHPITRQGIAPPWDFTDPNPVTLISARGHYLVVIQADPGIPQDDEPATWVSLAMELLGYALEDWGIGAKTNAGYGRMMPVEDALGLRTREEFAAEQAEKATAEEKRRRAAGIAEADAVYREFLADIAAGTGQDANQPNAWYQKWKALSDDSHKHESGTAILASWKRHGQYSRLVVGKPGSSKPRDQPKDYAKELAEWVDRYSPEEGNNA